MVLGNGVERTLVSQQFIELTGYNGDSLNLVDLNNKLSKDRGIPRVLPLSDRQVKVFAKKQSKRGDMRVDLPRFERMMADGLGKSTRTRRVVRALTDGVIARNQRIEVHSYLESYNFWPPPLFILAISIAQIAMFCYDYFHVGSDSMTACAGCKINGKTGPLVFVPQLKAQAWRFISYQFLHDGFAHLLGNVAMQCLIGVPLEIVHKSWRIAPLYLLAVLSGSLLQYLFTPAPLIGASAGVYALITAHLANVFINWSEMPFRWLRLLVVGAFLLLDLGQSVYTLASDNCQSVSYSAHIAGAITGFCCGIFVLYNVVEHTWEKITRYFCLTAYVTLSIMAIILVIFRSPPAQPLWLCSLL